jgi:hypothetical protein
MSISMSISRSLVLLTSAGLATAAHAQPHAEHRELADAPRPAVLVGHVYINVSTGERTVTRTSPATRSMDIFENQDIESNGSQYWAMDNPTLTFPTSVGGGPRVGGLATDWGDIAFDTHIDSVRFAYATMVGSGESVPGYTISINFHDCDNGFNDVSAVPAWRMEFHDISGWDPTLPTDVAAAWIYTIDLENSMLDFELGDTDLRCDCDCECGIVPTGGGCDKDDTDGNPKNDFGWGYLFDQSGTGLPLALCGPMLVLPASADIIEDDHNPTGASGNADGVADAFDFYKGYNTLPLPWGSRDRGPYVTSYWNGGWPANPYASFYLGLSNNASVNCAPSDYNADGFVDILDFLDFTDDFGACENQPTPCTSTGNDPDIYNPDGFIDIIDFLNFFDLFGQCD